MKLPISINDFKEVRTKGFNFVDKTLFIKNILDGCLHNCFITRPRQFGKTFNMSMLRYFFDIRNAKENRSLFKDTLIETATLDGGKSCMDFQGKYPVLFITLEGAKGSNYDEMYASIVNVVSKL